MNQNHKPRAGNLPPLNPYLADSPWSKIHGGSDSGDLSRCSGPIGPSRVLREDEKIWKAMGPFELVSAGYSGLYPDGRRTLLLGTHQHMVKLDADTLETLSTYALREGKYFSVDEIERIVREFDILVAEGKNDELIERAVHYIGPSLCDPQLGNVYTFINRDNERLFFINDRTTGKRYLRFYGDAIALDAGSDIVLKRQWEIPEIGGRPFVPFAADMTFDGWIIVVSNTGMVMAIANDFSEYHTLDLAPGGDSTHDGLQSFMRNGISVDDQNGIYIVTKQIAARVQWTGTGLTLDPASGAWQAAYASGPRGSGATPALMGFGDDEDHLLMITDGTDDDPHVLLLWRDAIPPDWRGIEGYDRRVAGVAPVMFAPGVKSRAVLENSPCIRGYGVFAAPETPTQPVASQNSIPMQFLAEAITSSLTGSEPAGGTKWQWDPVKRALEIVWMSDLKLATTICSVSVNGILYSIGRRDGQFTLEGLDWNSGASVFHYILGPSFKYFAYNNVVVAPNGAVDLFNWVGMGLMRMQPKA